jgi:hypothetical protein
VLDVLRPPFVDGGLVGDEAGLAERDMPNEVEDVEIVGRRRAFCGVARDGETVLGELEQ